MANIMNEKDFEDLRKLFIEIDTNGDGVICAQELKEYLITRNSERIRSEIIEQIFSYMD